MKKAKPITVPCAITPFGFTFGAAQVERLAYDERRKWVLIGVNTPKHLGHGIQIYITKTGKIRIFDEDSEWIPTGRRKETA